MEFVTKYKKFFLVGGFIAVVLLLGYLLYAIFFKAPPEGLETGGETATSTTVGGLPVSPSGSGQVVTTGQSTGLPGSTEGSNALASEKAQGGLTKTVEINQTPSLGTTLSKDGTNLQYYNQDDGKFYKVNKNGQITALADKTFYNISSITWSPDRNQAILEYPDGANIVYNFTTDKQTTLPSHWEDFDFSPDGEKIVMKSLGLDPNNRWLAITNQDGSETRAIEEIGEKDATVYPSWSPNNQVVAMYTEGVDFDRQEVFFLGLNDENFKSMVVEGRGFEPKWFPEGDRLLYSVYSSDNDLKPMLWTAAAEGDDIGLGRKSLNIETWADKCVFADASGSDLYCAVPKDLEKGAGLFPELADNTYDQLYKIDPATGAKKLIATPDGFYSMSDLIVSSNGYQLYFTDDNTKKIYKINLK